MHFPKAVTSLSLASLSLVFSASFAQAPAAPPTSYTIIEAVAAGTSPGTTMTTYRSGTKVMTVMKQPAQGDTAATRMVTLYDLKAGTTLSWNSLAQPPACSAGTFSGDWGDPFGMTAEITSGVAKGELKLTGTDTVAGIPADVYTGGNAQDTTKAWFDKAHGLVIKAVAKAPGAAPMTLVDIRRVSFDPPPATLFAAPAACAGMKPPPTAGDLIAAETGDDGANYVNGMYGPGSKNSCSVVLRVVNAKTMTPIEHVQVAIDTTYNQDNPTTPHYEFGVRGDGSQSYAGGGIKEITSNVHNGTVRLGSPPAYFMLGVNVIHPGHGGGMGLVYRQCFAPTQVLLYVVKDFGQPTEAGDFLWVKGGKYATPAAN
jgi:hypothetical protein